MADIEKANDSHVAHSAPVAAAPHFRPLANPAPLGLFSFASTTLVLSLINVQARGVTVPNIVLGMAFGVGGLAQLLAGMWEFACGNTFGATAFSSYGGFWISFAIIYVPGFNVLGGYSAVPSEISNAVGFYLTSWFIFTFLMFLGSLRSTAGLASLFFFLTLTFMFLAIGSFLPDNVKLTKAGGGLGIVTAAIAYYCAAASIITPDSSFFPLPVGALPKRRAD